MSRIFVAGIGAVSPAGWTVAAMREALDGGTTLSPQPLVGTTTSTEHGRTSLLARLVPAPAARPAFLSHPRLRRTSPITHYSASAALEAMSQIQVDRIEAARIGLIVCLQSGCVQYSCRFYQEALDNPATASPLLFPETVHAAPASHVAALLKNVTSVTSQVGDPSSFLQGMALGAQWVGEERTDFCLVIGAEEPNWITADALRYFDRSTYISAGAGAICLCREPDQSIGVELTAITDSHTYSALNGRAKAALTMRKQLNGHSADNRLELLCDGQGNSPRLDAAEAAAWHDWTGARLSPTRVLGQGLMAGAAWQCVTACDAVAKGRFKTAKVSLVGLNLQAIGAKFEARAQ
ncbi:MAG TPA: hypothetical protein VGY98_09050 [Verrucomicrobiae bacterium]|nr:hypothetical protein [Verrucomicrobiae bacterium]